MRTRVARARQRGGLFTLKLKGTTLIPKVQLIANRELNATVTALVRLLVSGRLDEWVIWAWLVTSIRLLDCEIPGEVVE